jgi:hypothetical protein
MLLLALALAGFSVWVLIAELPRSGVRRLPINSDAAAIAATARARAAWAATFGGVRGDLWAESAFTYATLLSPGPAPDAGPSTIANHARTVILKSARVRPLQIGRLASRREARIPIQLDECKSHRHPQNVLLHRSERTELDTPATVYGDAFKCSQ